VNDLFMRDDAPLTEEEWEHLDSAVEGAARQFLVGRRFIELSGPFGEGTEVVPVGTDEDRRQVPLQVIHSDFHLVWRDVAANRRLHMPIELGPAARAAFACAQGEDELVFGELLSLKGRNTVSLLDWGETGNPFQNVVDATQALVEDGFFGPYAVVLSPALYNQTQRYGRGMRLESQLITDVAKGGLLQSPVLKAGEGLVVSMGKFNLDLAIGQDLITAYMGNLEMDHLFRVFETLALRIKRPEAVCTFES
jgi:uncharacterized linocin/CFP29 family protein